MVTINGAAPAAGLAVEVSSNNAAAQVPSTVTIQGGASAASFNVTTSTVATATQATITAMVGSSSKSAILMINPVSLLSVTVDPSSVPGGASTTGTVTLTGPARSGGTVVQLTSSSSVVKVPATVKLAAGQTMSSFAVGTSAVTATTVVTISASAGGVTKTTTLTVTPPGLTSISLNPSEVSGPAASTGTAVLSAIAPKGGYVVKLSSSSKSATVPVSVTIPAGHLSASFVVHALAVGTQTSVTISGTLNGTTKSATLTIDTPKVTSVTLSPSTVVGGKNSTGTVHISTNAPTGGVVVTLGSSNSSATVPGSVTIGAGKSSATFTVHTSKVTAKTSATISATLGGSSKSGNLTINK